MRVLQWLRLGHGQSRGQELNPGLLLGWQDPNYVNHHCCFPGSALAGSQHPESEPGIERTQSKELLVS